MTKGITLSCNRSGLNTVVCGRPGAYMMTVKVSGHVTTLIACVDCVTKAPASLGAWTPIPRARVR